MELWILQPKARGTFRAIFPPAFAHFVFMSHFGNSRNRATFLIIGRFVRVICDQGLQLAESSEDH